MGKAQTMKPPGDEKVKKDPEKKRKARGRVFIDEDRCKGCGICIAFCPTKVLQFSEKFNRKGYHPPDAVNPEACTGCDLCGMYCPDFAIHGVRIATKKDKKAKDE